MGFVAYNRESKEEKLEKSKWKLLKLPSRIASTKFYASPLHLDLPSLNLAPISAE